MDFLILHNKEIETKVLQIRKELFFSVTKEITKKV